MWNDEDNNPYGSFDRNDSSNDDPTLNASQYDHTLSSPSSQSSGQEPDYLSRQKTPSDEEDDQPNGRGETERPRRKGGYDSRIQQILYENPDLEILIVDAGKNAEGGGYIVYTIRTGEIEVRRRYSEFNSLRSTLLQLHPTLIIPPIPEKHTMADYASKPTKAKEDAHVIELRKRMLSVFLNRCRRMREVLEDGVWWRFLDPNSSWNEVVHSPPVSLIPKNNLKAPPLDPANPSPGHSYLPVPSASAKLRSASISSGSGTSTAPPDTSALPSVAAHTIPGPQIFGRLPPATLNITEQELDPYFVNFEASTRELELLMQGIVGKTNRRTLEHLTKMSSDLMELGARYNGFSLSEPSPTVAAAIERIGQAVDTTFLATQELSSSLGAGFVEPMGESAQFSSVVRSVLRYRVLKRIQQEMTVDILEKKRDYLNQLETSEREASRLEAYMSGSTMLPSSPPKRSTSSASTRSQSNQAPRPHDGSPEETASIDSDFPPTHGESPPSDPSANQSSHRAGDPNIPKPHKKNASGNFVTNLLHRINHATQGIVDHDPERTRRDQMSKTKESLAQLEQALDVSERDVKDASSGILKDLKRFQREKEEDLRRYMIAYGRAHIEWAHRTQETWMEAREEVDKIRPM